MISDVHTMSCLWVDLGLYSHSSLVDIFVATICQYCNSAAFLLVDATTPVYLEQVKGAGLAAVTSKGCRAGCKMTKIKIKHFLFSLTSLPLGDLTCHAKKKPKHITRSRRSKCWLCTTSKFLLYIHTVKSTQKYIERFILRSSSRTLSRPK